MSCEICDLQAELRTQELVVDLGPHWAMNVYQGPGRRPRWVIQAARHVTSISKLNDGELASLGRAVGYAVREIEKSDDQIERVYVLSMNETEPGHPHVHLIPRFKGEVPNPALLPDDIETDPNERVASVLRRIARQKERVTHGRGFVAHAREAIDFWNRRVSPYALFSKLERKKREHAFDAGERYVLSWLAALAALLGASVLLAVQPLTAPWQTVFAFLISVFAVFRLIDIAVYCFGILLTTHKSALQSVARSLILFLLNLLEIALVTGILLINSGNPVFEALLTATGVVTASGSQYEMNQLGSILLILPTVVTLEVFALGIGMIVGKVGETFIDQSR